jgi:Zn-dependent protease
MLILSLLQSNPLVALTFIAGLVFGITIHEFSHALVAYRLGDPTAKLAGRLNLNPASHLDPIGTIALLIVGMGWGKPTPFDPFNLRNIKRDSALISVAGALSNFLFASVLSLPYLVAFYTGALNQTIVGVYQILAIAIWINLILGVFNLIPVSPLDGFKVLAGLLPRDWYYDFIQTERYGIFILILLLFTGVVGRILFPIVSVLFNLLMPGFSAPF